MEHKAKGISQSPCTVNRASECGHPCKRYLVFNRTNWKDKKTFDANTQLIFDIGNDIEKRVLADMTAAGFQIIEQQRHFEWKELQLTGHVDGKIVDGTAYPFEIKSMSPFMFKAINTIQDMLRSKYSYMRKYPYQLLSYMLMDGKEKGLFLLKDKSSGQMKELWMDIDYSLGDELINKLKEVNEHIEAGTTPEPIEWDEDLCGRCPFLHICLPDKKVDELPFVDNAEIELLLERYFALKPSADEYDDVEKELKVKLEGMNAVVGNFYISGKWIEKKPYTAEIKASRYWKREIKMLG
jgi:CRISPR/Cas system-associated exonuclease Cas4 (RecB family)